MPLDSPFGDTYIGLAKVGLALDDIELGVAKAFNGLCHLQGDRYDNLRGNLNVIRDAAAGVREAAIAILTEEEPEIVAEVRAYMDTASEGDLARTRDEATRGIAARVALNEILRD